MKKRLLAGFVAGVVGGWAVIRYIDRARASGSAPFTRVARPPQEDAPHLPLATASFAWGEVAAVSHVGRVRERNEDTHLMRVIDNSCILVGVADGMGGHQGGETASRVAVTTLAKHATQLPAQSEDERYEYLLEAFNDADTAIRTQAEASPALATMGTTLVAAVLAPGGAVYAYTGDSRLYHIRDGRVIHRTRDHTGAQVLVDQGVITDEQARQHPLGSRLTACLGGSRQASRLVVEPCWKEGTDQQPCALSTRPGDLVLLCSDGLHGELSDAQIVDLVRQGRRPGPLVQALLNAALDAGGGDNITIIAARWS